MKHREDISDEELNQEINDKLTELWTGMNGKRKQLVRNITPSYSRRTDNASQINQSSTYNVSDHQIIKIRDKLANQVSSSKKKDAQIENLKKKISQLTKDKDRLAKEFQQVCYSNENVNQSLLNQSSIDSSILQGYKNTASFPNQKHIAYKSTRQYQPKRSIIKQEPELEKDRRSSNIKLEDFSKNRLVELLRSTVEYREFVYYYDSHELSYLKRLQQQHKRNCENQLSTREKSAWAPTAILRQFNEINERNNMKLSEIQLHLLIKTMKEYYESYYDSKIEKNKEQCEGKYRKIQRQYQNSMPYDLVQLCKAKERQLIKNTQKQPQRKTRVLSYK